MTPVALIIPRHPRHTAPVFRRKIQMPSGPVPGQVIVLRSANREEDLHLHAKEGQIFWSDWRQEYVIYYSAMWNDDHLKKFGFIEDADGDYARGV